MTVGSDVLKSGKKVPFIVFSSHGKPFRNLLIDRCQPFGVIFMNFLSEFTNPLVKREIFPGYWPSLKPIAELDTVTDVQCQVVVLKSIPLA